MQVRRSHQPDPHYGKQMALYFFSSLFAAHLCSSGCLTKQTGGRIRLFVETPVPHMCSESECKNGIYIRIPGLPRPLHRCCGSLQTTLCVFAEQLLRFNEEILSFLNKTSQSGFILQNTNPVRAQPPSNIRITGSSTNQCF